MRDIRHTNDRHAVLFCDLDRFLRSFGRYPVTDPVVSVHNAGARACLFPCDVRIIGDAAFCDPLTVILYTYGAVGSISSLM